MRSSIVVVVVGNVVVVASYAGDAPATDGVYVFRERDAGAAPACVSPETETACRDAVEAAGLDSSGCGYPFAKSYGSGRGCYTYQSGKWSKCGWWSTLCAAPPPCRACTSRRAGRCGRR